MSVNTGLSAVSDHVLMVAVIIYSLALLAYAGDFAYGRRAQTATTAAKPVSELAGVGVRGARPESPVTLPPVTPPMVTPRTWSAPADWRRGGSRSGR